MAQSKEIDKKLNFNPSKSILCRTWIIMSYQGLCRFGRILGTYGYWNVF